VPHDNQRAVNLHQEATAIHAIPAQYLDYGFRLLVLRQFCPKGEPPAFAWIEQSLLRTPHRLSRHGLSFANTFLPEIMAWLGEHLGRPSLRASTGEPYRNSLWPTFTWHSEDRLWPGGIRTVEWSVEVNFQDEASWSDFQKRWHDRLAGKIEEQ